MTSRTCLGQELLVKIIFLTSLMSFGHLSQKGKNEWMAESWLVKMIKIKYIWPLVDGVG
jgi:hypothetical protein